MFFKDINSGFYMRSKLGCYASTFEEIERVKKANSITASALYNYDRCGSVRQNNKLTLSNCHKIPDSLTPVLRLLPPAFSQESYDKRELLDLIQNERPLFRIHPQKDACPLTKWMYDWMLDILCDTDTALLVSLEEINFNDLIVLKEQYPRLRIVITNTTQWLNRQYIRFVLFVPNVYIDTSNIIEYFGLESIVNILGADRILFGTNMPDKEPYDKMSQLIFSGLSEEQKQLIAYGNYENLVKGCA